MRLVPPRTCESRVCCSSGPGAGAEGDASAGGGGGGGGGSGGGGGGGGPAGESTASASDVLRPDEGGTKPGLRSTACLGCVVTSRGGRDGLNLLGGVGVAVVMGVGGAEVGVGGSDSDERKQTPVLAEDDQEGSCFAALSGFSAIAQTMGVLERTQCAPVVADTHSTGDKFLERTIASYTASDAASLAGMSSIKSSQPNSP